MVFVIDKEELKPGLIIFRRGDVQHRNWYCRVKLPKADRYKTIGLKTSDINTARDKAFDHDADVRFRIKHDVPVFNRPFSEVAQEYIKEQERRAAQHEITDARVTTLKFVINGPLQDFVGTAQIHLVGQDRWESYPAWRRANGQGRLRNKVISDATIGYEMSTFNAVMNFAVKKRYVPASQRFEGKPKLDCRSCIARAMLVSPRSTTTAPDFTSDSS